nr:hypothetical protein [Tanacetum cinerariifolium]
MELILEDKDVMDKGVADELKKRKPDDADKDEGPTAGSDRGLKRQRISKGTETSKKMSTSKDSYKGKIPSTSSKSSKSGKSAKDQVVKPISVHDSDNDEHDNDEFDNTDMPIDQGENLVKTDEQPNDEVVPKNDWYKKSRSDTSPDTKWNEGKLVDHGPKQIWLYDLAKATKPPLTFDELMHAPIDFSAFTVNRLKNDNLTKEHLVGPVYNLLKGTCKIYVELDYTMEECYRALSENLRGTTLRVIVRILSIISVKMNEWYGYGYLEEIVVKRANQKIPSAGGRKLPEEAQPHQAKNLRCGYVCRPSYTTLLNPQGMTYEDKLKRKRFMRADELHKFSDGTLILVHETLDQMFHELHLGYNTAMRRRLWTRLDQQRTRIMINVIPRHSQNWKDLHTDIPLVRIEVLRYDKKEKNSEKGKMRTKIELTLKQTQQGVSDEVLVSIEEVEE